MRNVIAVLVCAGLVFCLFKIVLYDLSHMTRYVVIPLSRVDTISSTNHNLKAGDTVHNMEQQNFVILKRLP